MVDCKSDGPKRCNDKPDVVIDRISHLLHHLVSLLGDIELIVLCAFVSIIGYFDAQIKETVLYDYGGLLTCLFEKM